MFFEKNLNEVEIHLRKMKRKTVVFVIFFCVEQRRRDIFSVNIILNFRNLLDHLGIGIMFFSFTF